VRFAHAEPSSPHRAPPPEPTTTTTPRLPWVPIAGVALALAAIALVWLFAR
jgi:hypothetical protein